MLLVGEIPYVKSRKALTDALSTEHCVVSAPTKSTDQTPEFSAELDGHGHQDSLNLAKEKI